MFYKSKILLFVVIALTSFASWVSAQGLLLAPVEEVKTEKAKLDNKVQEVKETETKLLGAKFVDAKKTEPKLLNGKVVEGSKPILMPAKKEAAAIKPTPKAIPKQGAQPMKKPMLVNGSFDELPDELGMEEPELKEEVVIAGKKPAKKEFVSKIDGDKVENVVSRGVDVLIADEIAEENTLFSKMSEIEREAALLTLELKREKIQNDIQAVKKQRQAAEDDEKARKEELAEAKRREIQEEQRKMLVEQQKLKDKEIEFEKLRQEKLVNSYKEKMLADKQKWIDENRTFYKKFDEYKQANERVVDDAKSKINNLTSSVESLNSKALEAKKEKELEVADLKTQISVLKAQLDAHNPKNPFDQSGNVVIQDKLENIYAIVEVRGKGDKLIAKLMNKDGKSLLAQVGTELKTGHVVDEITETHLRADREGVKDFVYFITPDFLNEGVSFSGGGVAVSSAPKKAEVTASAPRRISVYAP